MGVIYSTYSALIAALELRLCLDSRLWTLENFCLSYADWAYRLEADEDLDEMSLKMGNTKNDVILLQLIMFCLFQCFLVSLFKTTRLTNSCTMAQSVVNMSTTSSKNSGNGGARLSIPQQQNRRPARQLLVTSQLQWLGSQRREKRLLSVTRIWEQFQRRDAPELAAGRPSPPKRQQNVEQIASALLHYIRYEQPSR